ncbi:BTAD domain-containing putative transcriptional regulator [Streptomyces sp. CG1]|uniref:AfsR/SARP family transcriptional regulator n=1 Tax=Streptomyces sp. CG1 TaxID=1287523 RepID=UPI0034E302A1
MEINLLGPISVENDGVSAGIGANKVRALLATLALEAGMAISHAELVDELWSGNPLENTLNALQVTVTRLRKVLDRVAGRSSGASMLKAVHNGYVLTVPPECIDGNRFLDLAAEGTAALRERLERAVRVLEASLSLWRGSALLDAGDGLRCRGAAALFEERRLVVLEELASARLATCRENEAIPELQRLVAQFPLRERFSELLMLALYRTGRQGEALEAFRVVGRRLDEQLGVPPGHGLRACHARILAQDPALCGPSAILPG